MIEKTPQLNQGENMIRINGLFKKRDHKNHK